MEGVDHYKAHKDEKGIEGCEVQYEDLVEYFGDSFRVSVSVHTAFNHPH